MPAFDLKIFYHIFLARCFHSFSLCLNVELLLIMMCVWGEGVGLTDYKKFVARGKICREGVGQLEQGVRWEFG